MYLIADTETTGFFNEAHPPGSPIQPHICQLGAQLCTEEGRVVMEMNMLLKPHHWGVPKEAEAVHGISTALCEQYGLGAVTVMKLFSQMVKRAKGLVCHRAFFDRGMIHTELIRVEAANELLWFIELPTFCTMEGNIKIMNLPPTEKMLRAGRNNPKTPNLQDAHEFYCGTKFDDAHDAMADVNATRRVFFAMKKLGHVPDFTAKPTEPTPAALPESMEV